MTTKEFLIFTSFSGVASTGLLTLIATRPNFNVVVVVAGFGVVDVVNNVVVLLEADLQIRKKLLLVEMHV
jgi:hypothetical protein